MTPFEKLVLRALACCIRLHFQQSMAKVEKSIEVLKELDEATGEKE
jgi:hypothetical protein